MTQKRCQRKSAHRPKPWLKPKDLPTARAAFKPLSDALIKYLSRTAKPRTPMCKFIADGEGQLAAISKNVSNPYLGKPCRTAGKFKIKPRGKEVGMTMIEPFLAPEFFRRSKVCRRRPSCTPFWSILPPRWCPFRWSAIYWPRRSKRVVPSYRMVDIVLCDGHHAVHSHYRLAVLDAR